MLCLNGRISVEFILAKLDSKEATVPNYFLSLLERRLLSRSLLTLSFSAFSCPSNKTASEKESLFRCLSSSALLIISLSTDPSSEESSFRSITLDLVAKGLSKSVLAKKLLVSNYPDFGLNF